MSKSATSMLGGVLFGLVTAIAYSYAEPVKISYQGRVTSNGTNFTGLGRFKFALVTTTNTARQATAAASLSGQFVTSYIMSDGGNGYTSPPLVTVSGGGGFGATAVAVVSGGQVTAINPVSAGAGYASVPDVIIDPPPANLSFITFWSNDESSASGSEPATNVTAGVSGGLFTVLLGDETISNMFPIDSAVFTQRDLQLKIWFSDGVSGFTELNPPQPLSAAPYAAGLLGSVPLSQLPESVSYVNAYSGNNFFIGRDSGNFNLNGSQNVALGDGALRSIVGGVNNVAIGHTSMSSNISGAYNTALGSGSLRLNTNGYGNTAVGSFALSSNGNGAYNTAVGFQALLSNTNGVENSAFGASSLMNNNSGSQNSSLGLNSLYFNTAGSRNCAFGRSALANNTLGNGNVALGYQSLYNNTSGSNNVGIGPGAAPNVTTGNNNIMIGVSAGSAISTGSNNICIGNAGFGNESDVIRIGTTQAKAVMVGIHGMVVGSGTPVYVNPSGLLGTAVSSVRYKEDVQEMDQASESLLKLQPVTFRYKPEWEPEGILQYGLIAEEVEKIDPTLVSRDQQGRVYSVRYDAVNAMLLNEFLKQHRTVLQQEQEIENLRSRLGELEAAVKKLSGKHSK